MPELEPRPFEIPELLVQILSHLDPVDLRQSALLVKQEWAQICLDFLWYEVDDLCLLFGLLAPISQKLEQTEEEINAELDEPVVYEFDERPNLNQLKRFEVIYAPRVRVITLPSDDIDVTAIFDEILLLKPTLPLLSNLIALNWSTFSGNVASDEAYAALFMHHSVRTFEIRCWSFMDSLHGPFWDNPRRIAQFGRISKRMPNLETLKVSSRAEPDFRNPLLDLIGNLPHLRSVVLPAFSDPTIMLSGLRNCCDLEEIRFSGFNTNVHVGRQLINKVGLASISPSAFEKLQVLSLTYCGFQTASLILEHLVPLRLTCLAVESGFEDTSLDVQKLCRIIAQIGRHLRELHLIGLRFNHELINHRDFSSPPGNIVHFQDIKAILECSELESFKLGYPLDLPLQEHESIALAWPKLRTGELYVFDSINPEDAIAVQVRRWRRIVQKAFLSPGKKVSDSKEDMLLMDDTFNSISAFSMTPSLLMYSKIRKIMAFVAVLHPDNIPLDKEFKFRERAKLLVDRWQLNLVLNPSGLNINFRSNVILNSSH
ncbi:hypothetical protein BT96DRAFT_925539 [Gymnopus androsaceus JB14]|uniref:F-box domain-containing protein n=1 Tax=Gymnopus androsaceus JB14 TaxID=1447944 RepID=A0A6A4H0Z4_9AGAR|nr:hypothetical protein BT96DRAFT_925539 [Gymnopus androsaceus JB14]